MLVTADAAAELVKVAKAEAIGAIDDDGVGVRDIEAALDDRGGEEDVGLAVHEFGHDFFEFVGVHLAVSDEDARFGDEVTELGSDGVDIEHAIVEVKDLALAIHLTADGVANDALIVLSDDLLHGQAVLGRRLDGAHVARAGKRKVEGAWDRRGAEREDVDKLPEQLEFFLVHDAEPLLFVNNDEAEVFEGDVVLNEAMRADHDVDGTGGEVLEDPLLFARRAKTGEQFDAHGIIGHALAESVEVLLGEDGGGHEHGDLLAAHDSFEGSANGDFGFAEADVAADEAVHGLGPFEIQLSRMDRFHLVRSFLEDERAFEFALPWNISRKGEAFLRFARGLDGEELAGEIADGAFGGFFGFGPARAAEGVERRADFAGADVFADEVRFADGDIEFGRRVFGVAGRVFDDETFLAAFEGETGFFEGLGAAARGER